MNTPIKENETKSLLGGLTGSGKIIDILLKDPYAVAELHHMLTSPRGEFFRVNILSHLKTVRTADEIHELKATIGLGEYTRHMNKLIQLGLVQESKEHGKTVFIRTEAGEQALNAVRELERELGQGDTAKIFAANFRHNSIRLFLTIHNQNTLPVFSKKKSGGNKLEVRYTPQQISHVVRIFQHTIDGIAAIDKLNSAGILEYRDDGYIYFNAKKARAFYVYLKHLLTIVLSREVKQI